MPFSPHGTLPIASVDGMGAGETVHRRSAEDVDTVRVTVNGVEEARLEGIWHDHQVWQLREVWATTEGGEVALGDWLRASIAPDVTILTRSTDELALGRRLIEGTGRAVAFRKPYVNRDLDATLPGPDALPSEFGVRTLGQVGERAFAASMAVCAAGDPHGGGAPDPVEGLRQLIRFAGPAFRASNWVQVISAESVVGIVLPQLYWDAPVLGTLFYLGVAPEFRGRGLGRAFHLWGLHRLRQLGATTYVGSTEVGNTAMLRVFAANGCRLLHEQVEYGPIEPA